MVTKENLGSKVKDTITGTIGVLTAYAEYLHGAPRVEITLVDPTSYREIWLPVERLELVTE